MLGSTWTDSEMSYDINKEVKYEAKVWSRCKGKILWQVDQRSAAVVHKRLKEAED